MPTYVSLWTFTDQGIRSIGDTTKRANAFLAMAAQAGIKVMGNLWTLGRYDVIVTAEAPDDETMLRAMYSMASMGNVRTETLRAMTPQEMEQVIKGTESLRKVLAREMGQTLQGMP
jgi:uncharacterized protein with GYD domain